MVTSTGYPRLWLRQHGYDVPRYRAVPDTRPGDVTAVAPWAVLGLPDRWVSKLNRTLRELFEQAPVERDPNVAFTDAAWKRVERIASSIKGQVLPTNASDDDVLVLAEKCADECAGNANRYHDMQSLRARCEVIAARVQVASLDPKIKDSPAVRRYVDRRWWARRLREAHGRSIENGAIKLGLVHKRADVYVSAENLKRRQQQNKRNARILESTIATNDDGEQFTLADLAAKSVSNKAIRRGELMLRIRGMEETARTAKDAALFAVLTAPGYMHAVHESGQANAKHDGTTPREAQAWHAANWKRMTAALHRAEIRFYGARTVEPHHDGTPHWNVLLFVAPESVAYVKWLFRVHWLHAWSPMEPGALKHRLKLTDIDDSMGGATSYIAKYISKGIDGHGISEDLWGNPIIETTTRIEAWARTHGIRQFQTMCSASVMVWRELRRIKREAVIEANAPDELIRAWNACQKVAAEEGDEAKRADFAEFIAACGGPRVARRDAQLRLDLKTVEGETRYGEPKPDAPAGVAAVGTVERVNVFDGIAALGPGAKEFRYRIARVAVVPSVRRTWLITSGTTVGDGVDFGVPRTRVNNYTGLDLGHRAACFSTVDDAGFPIGHQWPKGEPPPMTMADRGSAW